MTPQSLLSCIIVITAEVDEHNHCFFSGEHGHVSPASLRQISRFLTAISRPVARHLKQEARTCITNPSCAACIRGKRLPELISINGTNRMSPPSSTHLNGSTEQIDGAGQNASGERNCSEQFSRRAEIRSQTPFPLLRDAGSSLAAPRTFTRSPIRCGIQ